MRKVFKYLRLVIGKWQEMVTGGLIAVYLALQPFTLWPAPYRWIFWSVIAGALAVASYRVWAETDSELQLQRSLVQQAAASESPRFQLLATWINGTGPADGELRLILRNTGRLPISNFHLRTLRLGLTDVEFEKLSDLKADVDRDVAYTMHGPGADGRDLLETLMFNWTQIEPKEFDLFADVEKQNGQFRTITFSMSYAPLHNPRRVSGARESERCITFTMVGSS